MNGLLALILTRIRSGNESSVLLHYIQDENIVILDIRKLLYYRYLLKIAMVDIHTNTKRAAKRGPRLLKFFVGRSS